MNTKIVSIAVGLALVGGFAVYKYTSPAATPSTQAAAPVEGSAIVSVTVPAELSAKAKIGERAFNAKCSVCHGPNAEGQQGVAPPLIHPYYRPNHHADEAFVRAAQNGVRSHHWTFGDMPPVKGVTRGDVMNIAAYIREIQRANGIN